MSNNYAKHIEEDRRLCVLRLLKDTHGSANDSVLHSALEALGHVRQPRSQIKKDIRFLVNHGLLTDEWVGPVLVATITRRGLDVAEGRITVDGVKSPSIGE